ncbi:hypothetical protein Htur_0943 [Haloterrigena turkmenica DSM 5511]|uniref:Uncharacterized protein n=1 Tax=Haloterrigena turkmenica (strain ATCC 51198 / DSM 5511 / JCM 9101 / NCIMB 13204 / VKM B-1734 / 4k) TaxID=543526 RepID=D2RYD6_HALTV|nr:hypothetical protein [Haloterrigena turkmenica]ADB59837.1 hypothetical protein Htur_0943 [Haloterrigena turkmenica DSM 5511]
MSDVPSRVCYLSLAGDVMLRGSSQSIDEIDIASESLSITVNGTVVTARHWWLDPPYRSVRRTVTRERKTP